MLAVRGFLQQLRHVCEVGRMPLAVLPRQRAITHAAQLRCLVDRGHPALACMAGPLAEQLGDAVGQLICACRKGFGRLTEEHRRRGGAPTPERCGWSNASNNASQSAAASRLSTSESPVCTGGTGVAQRPMTDAGVLVALDDHRNRGLGFTGERGVAGQQRADVGGQIPADVCTQVVDLEVVTLRPNVSRLTTRRRNGAQMGAFSSRLPL